MSQFQAFIGLLDVYNLKQSIWQCVFLVKSKAKTPGKSYVTNFLMLKSRGGYYINVLCHCYIKFWWHPVYISKLTSFLTGTGASKILLRLIQNTIGISKINSRVQQRFLQQILSIHLFFTLVLSSKSQWLLFFWKLGKISALFVNRPWLSFFCEN